MKKYIILLFPVISILFACNDSSKKFNVEIIQIVDEAEKISVQYDSSVQHMLDIGAYDSILIVTNDLLPSLAKKIVDIQALEVPANAEKYQRSAENYIESLLLLLKAQSLYSAYNDSIPEKTAEMMDNKNVEAVENAQKKYSLYNEYQQQFLNDKNL